MKFEAQPVQARANWLAWNAIHVVLVEEEIAHTAPFCERPACACHDEYSRDYIVYIYEPLCDGLLTPEEAERMYYNEQI